MAARRGCGVTQCRSDMHAALTAAGGGARAVVAAQMNLTQRVLARCDTRDQFRALFSQIYNYPKFGAPFQRGRAGGVVRCAPGLSGVPLIRSYVSEFFGQCPCGRGALINTGARWRRVGYTFFISVHQS